MNYTPVMKENYSKTLQNIKDAKAAVHKRTLSEPRFWWNSKPRQNHVEYHTMGRTLTFHSISETAVCIPTLTKVCTRQRFVLNPELIYQHSLVLSTSEGVVRGGEVGFGTAYRRYGWTIQFSQCFTISVSSGVGRFIPMVLVGDRRDITGVRYWKGLPKISLVFGRQKCAPGHTSSKHLTVMCCQNASRNHELKLY